MVYHPLSRRWNLSFLVASPPKLFSNRSMSNGGRWRQKNSAKAKLSQSSAKWLRRQAKDQYAELARKEGLPSRAYYKLAQIDELIRRQEKSKPGRRQRRSGRRDNCGLFRGGDACVDLGAAPGGWSIYTSRQIGAEGKLVAVDLLPLDQKVLHTLEKDEELEFVFSKADFNCSMTKDFIANAISNGTGDGMQYQADVIMSDMAANFTGNKSTDALRTLALCENAMQFAAGTSCFDPATKNTSTNDKASAKMWQDVGLLRSGGSFLCKFFQCGKENERMLLETADRRFEDVRVVKPPASRKESAERYLLARGFKG